ncbi:MAG: glycosyltransferase, partial [Planctomycetota bacterium]
ISELGISEAVTIIPQMQDWNPILSAADIFIRSWPQKVFSSLLLEAMSTGTVVAACTGGVDDLIIDGQTAVVFDQEDEISIMNTLRELLNRPEDAHKLAAGAQEYVKQHHKVSDMVESIIRIYQQAPSLDMN